ncbi:MAG: molybdate transporter substrate-binding protein [Pseudomonadota bacterium]|jgi:molybdate transport system substrate-binding protein
MLIRSLTRLALCALLVGMSPAMAQSRGPMVLAAASLQESLSAAADSWAAKGHAHPVLSFAASSALARQIDAGAPADLFISADEDWMDYLASRNRIQPSSRASFLTNRLVLIAPAASRLRLTITPGFPLLRALGPAGRLAMADPDAVPAGKYGKQALTALGLWPQVRPRLAPAENVRAALMLVARGAAPLGIVYATDARAAAGVRVLGLFSAGSHDPIRYPLALIATSRHPDAEGFRRFLLSAEGKALFARFGFGTR